MGKVADTTGRFMLGDGGAVFNAKIDLADGLNLNGDIKGDGLEFAYLTHDITVSPDMQFAVSPELV